MPLGLGNEKKKKNYPGCWKVTDYFALQIGEVPACCHGTEIMHHILLSALMHWYLCWWMGTIHLNDLPSTYANQVFNTCFLFSIRKPEAEP